MQDDINNPEENELNHQNTEGQETITKVTGMYKEWFLDYASYVILERAVPAIADGFKPVQRRILHSMKDLDDGRYNKVANIVGHCMQYHPHGDASIADAMVQIGQKELLIDMQGNWGNIFTGDRAAASRYIEARLSKFALDVVFNPKTTQWQSSYDGRRKEPINLPVKFPMLLAQGTGGVADVSHYNDGKRGGKVRVRAKITQLDKKTLAINEIPFSTTTTSLIDSIIKANDKGKIKIKKIEDNTAKNVEILIHLPTGISPDKTIDALYAFTNCEVSISPLCCVIQDHKPVFLGVSEILKISTNNTVNLLKKELDIQLNELEEQWHFASLERIFIENRIYREIEEEETWEGVISAIDKGLKPHITHLKRAVTTEDITRLTEIRIKRISKFDIDKAKALIEGLEDKITEVKHHLANLIDFAINYFKELKAKFGKDKKRFTEIKTFDDIIATKVVMRNEKLYVNRAEGFVGTSLKKDEFIADCADIDNIIVFRKNGTMIVSKVAAKTFVGKDIIHVAVFKKSDKRTIYNYIYRDGRTGPTYMKRFNVTGITRDRVYDLTAGNKGSIVLYFTANPNGEAETVGIELKALPGLKKTKWEIDLSKLTVKGRSVRGNLVSKNIVKKVVFKTAGKSTLKPRKIWFDDTVKRINTEERGVLLGEFTAEDKLLIATQSGKIKTVSPNLNMHFDNDMVVLEKWDIKKPISVVYYEGNKAKYYVKRFTITQVDKEEYFVNDHPKTKVITIATDYRPNLEVLYSKRNLENQIIDIETFIDVKGIKALGNQLTIEKIKQINILDPLPYIPIITENKNEQDKEQGKLF